MRISDWSSDGCSSDLHASSGVGSSQHLAAAQFGKAAGIELLHVPYKGSAQALNDLLSGEVDMNVDSPPLMVPNIKANKLVGIAVVSPKRIPLLPDVPTMAERSEEHTSELQSLMRISNAVFCWKQKKVPT